LTSIYGLHAPKEIDVSHNAQTMSDEDIIDTITSACKSRLKVDANVISKVQVINN
jgi:hypothetical protein